LANFLAYRATFLDGVRVGAVRSVASPNRANLLTAGGIPGSNGFTQQDPSGGGAGSSLGAVPAQQLDGLSLAVLDSFFAFPNYFGGVFIAGSR
jgi:hypothetical protein